MAVIGNIGGPTGPGGSSRDRIAEIAGRLPPMTGATKRDDIDKALGKLNIPGLEGGGGGGSVGSGGSGSIMGMIPGGGSGGSGGGIGSIMGGGGGGGMMGGGMMGGIGSMVDPLQNIVSMFTGGGK